MSECITDSQDEQSFEVLIRDVDQIHVPIFQRSYVWKQKQLDELFTDIDQVKSEVEEIQFMGAIVAYDKPRSGKVVGRLRTLEIVDGQQRVLTLYIFVMAIVECIAPLDKEEAFELVREFLLLTPRRGLEINTRIVPAFADRSQFRVIWDRINSPGILQLELEDLPPHLPPPSGEAGGDLVNQYHRILRYIKRELPQDGSEQLECLRETLGIVTRKLSFVHLKLNDASAATKIFERLNFRGVKVGIVDLVRNEIFSSLAGDPLETQRVFDHVWRPFESAFEGRSESFFFPYCLIQDSNTKKSELFVQLRSSWKGLTPQKMIGHMKPLQQPFMAIDQTGFHPDSEAISKRLERFVRMRRPSSIYPFVMSMLKSHSDSLITESLVLGLLDALESFLVRRAIVGLEPTGLHALFKGLWSQMKKHTVVEFKKQIASRPTIQWPSDADVRAAIAKRNLANANICPYLLVEYDRSLKGDNPSSVSTIEHILPQFYDEDSDWALLFSKEQHKQMKDLLANIIPLSSPLNSSLQDGAYSIKKDRYQKESMFRTPRDLAKQWAKWSPKSIEQRSKILADWAVSRWDQSL
ncbi:DUF262 domain-containing protein [Pseudomonas fluorescens]|uniref:DUF262 domain-containing protein n=1 Tax=Pseudomonas fluorescens TaxID=294 RepID=UPI00124184AB|nr:DUF262 domain-containing protein [Pseudomonas fluorescens]VVO77560.1 hypothetical protein PS898_01636 [Pseudomonas fluorescens]